MRTLYSSHKYIPPIPTLSCSPPFVKLKPPSNFATQQINVVTKQKKILYTVWGKTEGILFRMSTKSTTPATEEVLHTFEPFNAAQIEQALSEARHAFLG